jgi:hypothetical protein
MMDDPILILLARANPNDVEPTLALVEFLWTVIEQSPSPAERKR